MNITILYEDKDCVAINKPAGLVVHADGKSDEPTVCDWMLEHYPEAREVGEPIELTNGGTIYRPGIVHRLDRETSGVLLLAKTAEGHAYLKNLFQERLVKKTYHAFIYGGPAYDEDKIDRPIGRSKNDFRKWTAQRGTRGEMRDALTHYKVLKRGKDASLIAAYPLTGRTHQIRVHFKAINHPVVCDKLYAESKPCLFGFGRTALHARVIEFTARDGSKVSIEAPYPTDFQNALHEIGV